MATCAATANGAAAAARILALIDKSGPISSSRARSLLRRWSARDVDDLLRRMRDGGTIACLAQRWYRRCSRAELVPAGPVCVAGPAPDPRQLDLWDTTDGNPRPGDAVPLCETVTDHGDDA
jgi:hypothetical protein